MSDIGVILPTRSRPKECSKVLNMLYSQCKDKGNFEVLVIVDSDQIGLYDYIKPLYPEVKWVHPPHSQKTWQGIVDEEIKFVEETDYYFYWTITDDFYGLNQNWDMHILDKKGAFEDGIFSMYQSYHDFMGRHPWVNEKCYVIDDDPRWSVNARRINDANLILYTGEQLPIFTKKWAKIVYSIMQDNRYTNMPELINAGLVFLLKKEHNIKRFIQCGIEYTGAVDQNQSGKITTDGLSREAAWRRMASDKQYSELKPLVNQILKEIKNG